MLAEKKTLGVEELEAQAAFELPDREMPLITVVVNRVLNNNTVTVEVPISVAANICDVDVAALFAQIEDTGSAECTATSQAQNR